MKEKFLNILSYQFCSVQVEIIKEVQSDYTVFVVFREVVKHQE